ncbi:LOW QUALITY PROTEIN: protein tyrosine phosphatase receptor type C-associated protein [Harpia harpyja]|uniref:LOW QUALITY PROTEIN: protein tyrosine phosphatase receptor type C-associated protein n=1 Tax=Harpia harpyja TaxID=202280 RepID=UPI0022B1BD18|nr:LOW QUALITY PROTEIN: protein tyrosine phosphatase receptor type C-associated protein [Harpia harpyja]
MVGGGPGPGSSPPAPTGAVAPADRSFPSRGRPRAGWPPARHAPPARPERGGARRRWRCWRGRRRRGEPAVSRSDRAVGALLGLLLCLAVGLAVAWHHLCRLSAGRYHPRPMGRRALALLRGRWHRLRGRGGPAAQPCRGDGEMATTAPQDEEEELMPWSQEQRPEEEEEGEEEEEDEEDKDEQEEEEEEEEEEEAGESPPGGGQAAGGSAGALLGDLHAFSGTAAWGDARPHVTAL